MDLNPPARDALDDKVNTAFAGKVVRKDLVRKVKVGANVPVNNVRELVQLAKSSKTPLAFGSAGNGNILHLHLELFKNRVFTFANIAGFFSSMSFLSVVAFLPLFMQLGQGINATTSGLAMMPLTVSLVFGAALSGRLVSKYGRYKPYLLGGVALIAVISFCAVMLAVFALITVMSVMNGFRGELLGRLPGLGPRSARRVAARQARDAFPPMGIYAIRDRASGHVLLGASRNVHAALNRARFELRMGKHADRVLQAEWNRSGVDGLAFEVLELVKERGDAAFDYAGELQALEAQAGQLQSPGEPQAASGTPPRLQIADFQGRTWATASAAGSSWKM